MEQQLDYAPCGYLSVADDGTILSINQTMLNLLGYNRDEVQERHINTILTKSSQTFYQLYFFPLIKIQQKINEMFLTLKPKASDDISVLLNAVRVMRTGTFVNDCILFPMKKRHEYEQVILAAKKDAEEVSRQKEQVIMELEQVHKELELKQNKLIELNEELEEIAATDELTGLYNRRSYESALSQNLTLYNKTKNPFSLLLIDIDYFKNVNDTYGHLTGDRILESLGHLLKSESRAMDIPIRYGGEEFALILPGTDEKKSLLAGEKIRKCVETNKWAIPTPITVSIGIATIIKEDTKITIQSKADKALYMSKTKGRNQITHFSQLMTK